MHSVLAPDELESLASPVRDWWFEIDQSRDDEDAHGNGEMCKWCARVCETPKLLSPSANSGFPDLQVLVP